jgi:hypothetical protein
MSCFDACMLCSIEVKGVMSMGDRMVYMAVG